MTCLRAFRSENGSLDTQRTAFFCMFLFFQLLGFIIGLRGVVPCCNLITQPYIQPTYLQPSLFICHHCDSSAYMYIALIYELLIVPLR